MIEKDSSPSENTLIEIYGQQISRMKYLDSLDWRTLTASVIIIGLLSSLLNLPSILQVPLVETWGVTLKIISIITAINVAFAFMGMYTVIRDRLTFEDVHHILSRAEGLLHLYTSDVVPQDLKYTRSTNVWQFLRGLIVSIRGPLLAVYFLEVFLVTTFGLMLLKFQPLYYLVIGLLITFGLMFLSLFQVLGTLEKRKGELMKVAKWGIIFISLILIFSGIALVVYFPVSSSPIP